MLTEQNTTIQQEARKRREATYWAIVLIWAGLVFAVEQFGLLPQIGRADAWNWIFFGAGLLLLLWSIRRAAATDHPEPSISAWNLIWGGVLLILGLSGLTTIKIGFPLILILLGMALLGTALLSANKSL